MIYDLISVLLMLMFGLAVFLCVGSFATIILTWPAILNIISSLYSHILTTSPSFLQNFQKQLRQKLTLGGILLFLLTFISLFADLIGMGILPQVNQAERMTGDIRVAIAAFDIDDSAGNSSIGFELANNVAYKLSEQLSKTTHEYTITIWGPERIGIVKGKDKVERAKSAGAIAEKTGANLVVYGWLDNSNSIWSYSPEFFIDAENSYEVDDITGYHELGEPLQVRGEGNIAGRIDFSNDLAGRIQILTNLSVGLAYYLNQDFQKSLDYWHQAVQMPSGDNETGKKVLYLLLGNAAGKNKQIKLAEDYYKRCLAIDSNYARAYIGLANVYYIRALGTTIDSQFLHQAIRLFKLAETSPHYSELADISTKVHFGLGQSYFMLSLIDKNIKFGLAADEFSAVVSEYGNGNNPRVRVLAGESHARLGLIKKEEMKYAEAIREYQNAIKLLEDIPERQLIYKQRVKDLQDLGYQ